MDERVITYRVGQETNPTTMLVALAYLHGLEDEVQALVDALPEEAVEESPERLGPLLKRQRHVQSLTRQEVHERSNISLSQISCYESGYIKNPGLRTIQALSYGYRVPFIRVLLAALNDINPRMSVRKRPRPTT